MVFGTATIYYRYVQFSCSVRDYRQHFSCSNLDKILGCLQTVQLSDCCAVFNLSEFVVAMLTCS